MWHQSAIFENSWPPFCQIWISFTHLKLWIASAKHNFKWVKITFLIAYLSKKNWNHHKYLSNLSLLCLNNYVTVNSQFLIISVQELSLAFRIWRLKTVPALKESLSIGNENSAARKWILNVHKYEMTNMRWNDVDDNSAFCKITIIKSTQIHVLIIATEMKIKKNDMCAVVSNVSFSVGHY